MITTPSKTFLFHDNAVFISCSEPHRCRCGRMAYLFVNRNGMSLCLFCDGAPEARDVRVAGQDGKPLEFSASDPGDDPGAKQSFLGAVV